MKFLSQLTICSDARRCCPKTCYASVEMLEKRAALLSAKPNRVQFGLSSLSILFQVNNYSSKLLFGQLWWVSISFSPFLDSDQQKYRIDQRPYLPPTPAISREPTITNYRMDAGWYDTPRL